jgi:hypothetical protein
MHPSIDTSLDTRCYEFNPIPNFNCCTYPTFTSSVGILSTALKSRQATRNRLKGSDIRSEMEFSLMH